MTARKMLLGLGSPFSQTRVDFNRLHGTDTSSGTNPFTSPGNLNDGNDATHADRAAAPHASAYIVQQTPEVDSTPGNAVFASPVTAGNLLVIATSKSSHGATSIDGSSVFIHGGVSQARGFTKFATDVYDAADTAPYDPLVLGYRVATGDEQSLDYYGTYHVVIYEIANAGAPGTFEVRSVDQHAASSAKSLGPFSAPGALQIMAVGWGDSSTTIALDQVLGAGYTQDAQSAVGFNGHPGFVAGHGTTGATPQVTSGQSAAWCGMAVGITTSAGDTTSICQADLGAAYPVNRLSLLESAATGTQYATSYSPDGITWTPLAPTFSAVGALQTYELAATIAARYWRIADNHSPAIALGALAWDTWTIQGFPL